VGSLDAGFWKNIGTSLHTGAFRSENICGDGYFAREIIPDVDKFPHYLPTKQFRDRRDELTINRAGKLICLPKEIRLSIYEQCCLPDELDKWSKPSVISDPPSVMSFFLLHLPLLLPVQDDLISRSSLDLVSALKIGLGAN
jgi:hypothetical protein